MTSRRISKTVYMNRHTVFISVGSNMGDKIAQCQFGVSQVADHPDVELTGTSSLYRTAPVDYVDQDWFVNAAFRIATTLTPHQLLALTKDVQSEAGQGPKAVRFGPRTLDLDLIFYDDLILQDDELELPHPRAHKRRFVLRPICDIEPQFRHPVLGCSIAQLLQTLEDDRQEVSRINA